MPKRWSEEERAAWQAHFYAFAPRPDGRTPGAAVKHLRAQRLLNPFWHDDARGVPDSITGGDWERYLWRVKSALHAASVVAIREICKTPYRREGAHRAMAEVIMDQLKRPWGRAPAGACAIVEAARQAAARKMANTVNAAAQRSVTEHAA